MKIYTAPLASISDTPFRLINRMFGAEHCYSEMVSVEGLWRKHKNTKKLISVLEGDKPIAVQLFGNNPESFYKAVKEIDDIDYITEININSGCPVRKVVNAGSGSALMKTPDLLAEIVKAVRTATTKQVSVKLRSGWNSKLINVKDCARICESEGADMVIVHSRTADMFFMGHSDWEIIKDVKSSVKIPVVGNGDILNLDDAKKMVELCNCDAVMVGRALVGNPWFFTGKNKIVNDDFIKTVVLHMDLAKEFYGDIRAYKLMKKHLIHYAHNVDTKGYNRKLYYEKICKAGNFVDEKNVAVAFFESIK